MSSWLLLFFGILAIPYLVSPLFLFWTQRLDPSPRLRRQLPSFLAEGVAAHLDRIQEALIGEGFSSGTDVLWEEPLPNGLMTIRLQSQEAEGTVAISAVLTSTEAPDQPISHFVEFLSQWPDGKELSTHNSQVVGAPLQPAERTTVNLSFIEEPIALYRYHQAFAQRLNPVQVPVTPTVGKEMEVLRESIERELDSQAELGGLHLDEDEGLYRPTWAGAFLMAWTALWPVTFIRRMLHRYRAKSWVRQAGQAI